MTRTVARPLLLLLATAAIALAMGSDARAAQNGFGVAISSFDAADGDTQELFDIDSGPIPTLFYRWRSDAHSVAVGLGFQSWERNDSTVQSTIDFAPIFGTYRYTPWHDKPVSLVVGGGAAYLFYDAEIEDSSSFYYTLETQTGALLALEPLVGVAVRAGEHVLFEAEIKYSLQLLSTNDFDEFAAFEDIDMSGTYVTVGVSFLFGNPPAARTWKKKAAAGG